MDSRSAALVGRSTRKHAEQLEYRWDGCSAPIRLVWMILKGGVTVFDPVVPLSCVPFSLGEHVQGADEQL